MSGNSAWGTWCAQASAPASGFLHETAAACGCVGLSQTVSVMVRGCHSVPGGRRDGGDSVFLCDSLRLLPLPQGGAGAVCSARPSRGRGPTLGKHLDPALVGTGRRACCLSHCKGHVPVKARPGLGASEGSDLGPPRGASGISSLLCCLLVTSHRSLPSLLERCSQVTALYPRRPGNFLHPTEEGRLPPGEGVG